MRVQTSHTISNVAGMWDNRIFMQRPLPRSLASRLVSRWNFKWKTWTWSTQMMKMKYIKYFMHILNTKQNLLTKIYWQHLWDNIEELKKRAYWSKFQISVESQKLKVLILGTKKFFDHYIRFFRRVCKNIFLSIKGWKKASMVIAKS